MANESIKLSYIGGGSDKVYEAELKDMTSGWVVNFAYGRRGNTLTTGTKTKSPIPYSKAKKVYDKLVNGKISKGYTPNGTVGSTISVNSMPDDSGIRPQLLNEIEDRDAINYINDPAYCAQEKYDGRRRMLIKDENGVIGTNKKGFAVAINGALTMEMNLLSGNKILDGEAIDDYVMVFDIPSYSKASYKERYGILMTLLLGKHYLKAVPTAWTQAEKHAMYVRLKNEKAEGIVFKKIDAKVTPGRPASGGDQFKCKFYDTASCIVTSVSDTKRSVGISVLDDSGSLVDVGNVTIYPNQNIPSLNEIVEIKYLYFYPSGSLYQPVYLNPRDDVDRDECLLNKLKTKQSNT